MDIRPEWNVSTFNAEPDNLCLFDPLTWNLHVAPLMGISLVETFC